MKKILVVWDLTSEQKELLKNCCPDAEFVYKEPRFVTANDLEEVSVILGNLSPVVLKFAKKLEWVQLNSAGAAEFCVPGLLGEDVVLTNASGAYGLAISEHMLGAILMLQKRLASYYDNQKAHLWRDEGPVSGIWNSRTLVLGKGNIGTEFARRMQALGSHVVGIRRTEKEMPVGFNEQYQMEALERELAKADIVALCLPGTKETVKVLDEARLSCMKKTALLINVGRGTSVDNLALARFLNEERIAGAAIDVTDLEPLPRKHPLWDAKNALLTPHISGGYHMKETFEIIFQITAENLSAYAKGEPLRNVVNRSVGY